LANVLFDEGFPVAVLVDLVDGIEVWSGPDPLERDPGERAWRRSPERLRSIECERRSPAEEGEELDWDELELASRVVLRRPE